MSSQILVAAAALSVLSAGAYAAWLVLEARRMRQAAWVRVADPLDLLD